MKTSRTLTLRYLAAVGLAVVGLALGLALLSAGSAVPAAFGEPGDRVFLPVVLRSDQAMPHANAADGQAAAAPGPQSVVGGVAQGEAGRSAEGQADVEPAQPAAPQAGTNRYVAKTGQDSTWGIPNGCRVSQYPCLTIWHAIHVADSGDVIRIGEGTYAENLQVNKSLSFKAWSGTPIVDGSGSGPVFHILANHTVTIEGLGIQNGAANGSQQDGGGIYIEQGAELNVINVEVTNNSASIAGGGIFNGGTLTLTNSIVSGNRSTSHSGGIFNAGTLTLIGSTVSGNQSGNVGGGISNFYNGTVTLTNSSVSGNAATGSYGDGGGIYNYTGGTVTLTNSTVISNTSSRDGGGIYNEGTLTLTNSTVSDNSAGNGGNGDASMWGNGGNGGNGGSGGGIYNAGGGTLTVSRSTLSGNNAGNGGRGGAGMGNGGNGGNGGSGGGIYNASSATLVMTESTLSGNSAGNGGNGGKSTYSNGGNGGNGGSGGGIYNAGGGTLTVSGSTLSGNNAGSGGKGGKGGNGGKGGKGGNGGGIHNASGATLVMTESTLSGNGAGNGGDGGSTTSSAGGSGGSGGSGGGIYNASGATLELTNSTLSGNSTGSGGAGRSGPDRDGASGAGGSGGGVFNMDTLELTNSTIRANAAIRFGGGIYSSSVLTLTHSTVISNTAWQGGGLYNSNRMVVTDSTISANSAPHGGGIRNVGGYTLTLTNSTVSGNSSTAYGGGINNAGRLILVDSTVNDNSADRQGGGLFNYGEMAIRNSTISTNSAVSGGGVFNTTPAGNTDIRFTTIANNTATASAANVYNSTGMTVTLLATIIAGPQGKPNCAGDGLTSAGGYNRISDGSCTLQNATAHEENATIILGALAANGGTTLTHKPVAGPHNEVVDIMPGTQCRQAFYPDEALDQRGKTRPAWGIRQEGVYLDPSEWKCDAGAVELGAETHLVCGPPLLVGWKGNNDPDFGKFYDRCQYTQVSEALQQAQPGDTIVVSGVVTETVTVTKSVTIRGPTQEEMTPGTQMGIVQAAPDGNQTPGSVFTIITATQGVTPTVTIKNLNIRHGGAVRGGGINNNAVLNLEGVTIYHSHANRGGAVYNTGTLTVTNSTIVTNTAASDGAGIYNAGGGTVTLVHATLADNPGTSIHNANQISNSVTVSGTILSSPNVQGDQCTGEVTSDGYNLVHGGTCFDLAGTDVADDPKLGPLRDNGGPTLTRAITAANSPAVEHGPLAAACAVQTDQRGKPRPFDMPGGGGARCDIGAVEYGPATLTVCQNCDQNPDNLRFNDLQEALNRAMAGDTVAIEAGAYTGNFIAYKDVTLQHAGIDVATLSRDQPVDVRAILQASELTIPEQHRLLDAAQVSGLSGTVLTVHAFRPTGTTIAASDDVSVTLRGLTLRHGLSRQGGAIYNIGHLHVITSTIAGNAAVNELQGGNTVTVTAKGGAIYNTGVLTLTRSTVSGNQSEFYGGALYNTDPGAGGPPASARLEASTIAYNTAQRLPAQHVVNIESGPSFNPITLTVPSGDHIQFQNATPEKYTLLVEPASACNMAKIDVPLIGGGVSEPLICTTSQVTQTITVRSDQYNALSLTVTVNPLTFTPEADAIYASDSSQVTVAHSIIAKSAGSSGKNCVQGLGTTARIRSGGYNLVDDGSCGFTDDTDLRPATVPGLKVNLGPLQDNNAIDYQRNRISGYAYTHALNPGSPAIDQIPPEVCGAADGHTINIGAPQTLSPTIQAGDIVTWTDTISNTTVALNDGESNVRLIPVPANGSSHQVQFTAAGAYPYRVYDDATRAEIAAGTITVEPRTRAVDQRGMDLPQRGWHGEFKCDIGAHEFQPWVVGRPIPRPPVAIGTQAPRWKVGVEENTSNVQSYHAWSTATAQDFALRPSPDDGDADLEDAELVTVKWSASLDPAVQVDIPQYGIVEWPDDPQIHVSGARVDLTHDAVSDGFQVSKARAFEGRESQDNITLLTGGVFTRTVPSAVAGDSYSVLQFVKGTQGNAMLKVQVVKTVDWNTPGVRDMREERTGCEIGREIRYRSFTDAAGTLPGHQDPEGKAGQILLGDAFDGVRTTADLARVQNTVDGLVPPAHVQETREGPIIPILNRAPTITDTYVITGSHDLRVAWYRPDARNVAWPVKTVGYRCNWPQDPPEIVIASELGSEIGGQAVLNPDGFTDLTVYHQPDPNEPGFNPNDEHALLAASNLGNSAPALYALRTDLWDPQNPNETSEPYALLKYRDPRENNLPKIQIYKVVLTRPAQPITNVVPISGTIRLLAGTAAVQTIDNSQLSTTVRVGDGELPPHGEVTVPVEALGASNLRSITMTVSYSPTLLTPTACTTNRLDFVERLHGLQVATDAPAQPFHTVHMRAGLDAGTDAQYEWNFGDGITRIAGAEVSHVYGVTGTYTVAVTASNGQFADVTATTPVTITEDATPQSPIPNLQSTGCRIEQGNGGLKNLTIELKSRNKHGLSGDLLLTELTFEATGNNPPAQDTETTLGLASFSLAGPAYDDLSFNITAGNPVYAPTPLRGLLDIQPCPQTRAADVSARPFWKDFKEMLWARAAGDMDVLYFYPLQPGFYLTDDHARELGLVADDGTALPEDQRVGRCVPWMDQLPAGTVTYKGFPQPVGSTQPMPGFNDVITTTQVLSVSYHADWPDLPPLLSVGETVYERAKSGISGVANQLAVSRIYDDLAPGAWDNEARKIVITGTQVITSLAQLIDPIGEVRVPVGITINDNPALPEEIKTERLLFGGGLAIVGNKNDPDLALPFSLRSRILFDDINGELIFRGYYDGTSPEYIKGDPLLLLNVMSKSDKKRLKDLCPSGSANCQKYQDAVDALYHKTRNPRQVDLCRDANGRLFPGDPEPIPEEYRGTKNDALSAKCPTGTYRDGQADHAFLIGVQDANDDGIPEPYEGLGKGKALSAGNAAGTGYITVAYNNDPSLGGLPVSLQVIKVGCTKNYLGEDSTYRGNLLVVKSDNLFDEKLTLRHTGDFGGRPDNFEFEWWIAPVDETGVSPAQLPPSYPWQKWTRLDGADKLGPEITIEGANPTTLRDNWLIMRYKGYPVCGNQYRWSNFAGDPSAKPSEVRAQLAEGWIKRVTSGLNPFDTRVDDFVSAPVNTTVDMIRQAGHRYEGPIALSNDPENLNQVGLIEAYETVLDRGRKLSIDSGINDQGANAALLNVTSRIADLYMLLGNDAYMDALDPTVGLGTDSALGLRAPAIYAFMNQFRSDSFGLIDEELALLRGRDETLGGVAAAPTYNRLTWNFTNGDGEVAYVTNYNIKDMNQDGFVNEADAAIMYPQGHGDAWGHILTAIGKYYQLLRHPNYTWVPRAEPISVAGAPVVVDYYDERRFAIDAAAKARIGAEVVDLTYRKNYAEPESQEYVDSHVDASDTCDTAKTPGCNRRAWGVADWARRAGQGAYFDWVVTNAILPPEDDRYTDVRKIDRTTVSEIGEIANQYLHIQKELDQADTGVNPLGLAPDAVLFDLDPAQTKTTPEHAGKTHFEQVYDRAIASLGNTLELFNYANQMKLAQRESQDARRDFVTTIIEKDTALINELIDIFGYPYDADIGVNGTYPEGYDGPDIYNYDLWDRTELTDFEKRCSDKQITAHCTPETKTYLVKYAPMDCLGFFVEHIDRNTVANDYVCRDGTPGVQPGQPERLQVEHRVGTGLDKGRGRFKPASWPEDSARKAPGDIQNALQALYQARTEYEMAITAYQNQIEAMEGKAQAIKDRYEVLKEKGRLLENHQATLNALDGVILGLKETQLGLQTALTIVKDFSKAAASCVPVTFGFSNDLGSVIRCTPEIAADTLQATGLIAVNAISGVEMGIAYSKDVTERELQIDLFQLESDYELRQLGREMKAMIREERELRLALFLAKDQVNSAQGDYDAALQRGFRKLAELIRLRKRWAGQISEQRYSDMAYRVFQNDALQKYRRQFDMAQLYTYLTAAAYDYETNLAGNDPANGDQFLRQIVELRTLGQLQYQPGIEVQPVVGSGGLADPLARMRDNFAVLKGQMGFNNPQSEANRFSLRHELFRLRDDSDAKWRHELQRYYTPNIYSNDAVARLAKRPYGDTGPQPGLVIPIGTTIRDGLNYFGLPLGPGDSAYDATQFSTKIASVGIWFKGYDTSRLAQTPRVYLLPAGKDVMRPRSTSGLLRYWNITEQLLPLPYPISQTDMEDPNWIPRINGLDGQLYAIKPYARFRAYPYTPDFTPDEMNTDTRLIGRSVWNTQWLLVIPGSTLLSDPQVGIERFIEDVDDIYVYFQTYAYAGN